MKRIAFLIGIMCIAILVFHCGPAMATSGTYDGIDWDLTDGVLTLGKEGETQTLGNGDRVTNRWPWYSQSSTITSVVTNGNLVLHGSLGGMFSVCRNLTSLDLSKFDTSNVTDMNYMFSGCTNLTSLNVSNFDTSSVTNMSFMFHGCSSLTALDVSGFDTSNVTTMGYMFSGCSSLTSLDVSGFDTSKVTSMVSMFQNCYGLTALDVSGWDTSKVTSMLTMFSGCSGLTSLDVSRFNTSNVMNMQYMFSGCAGLTFLDVSNFVTSKVTDMEGMFSHCSGLTSLELSGFNTSKVTTTHRMFYYCTGLTSLELSNFDTLNVAEMTEMFSNCSSLISLDLSSFSTLSITAPMTMVNMFQNCSSLRSVVLGENNPFVGSRSSTYEDLPTPPKNKDGTTYTQKWIREDGVFGPFTSAELRNNYNSTMAGTWIWEIGATEYTIVFNADSYPTVTGAMPNVTVLTDEAYQLSANRFALFGYSFDHWDDGNGHTYADEAVIPANTYTAGASVTLSAVMTRRDTSVNMEDGEFTFSIYGNEKAFFDGVPAGTSYSVFEENLAEGWVLIAQSNSTGVIQPLEESEALFLNKYQPDLATIQFTGRKFMDGQPAKADSFSFELWEGNTLLQTKSVIDGGFVQFDMLSYGRNDAGIHTYTIKELVGTDDAVLYDGHEETITVEVTTELGDDNITRVHAEVKSSDGTYPDILFQNWTKPGELSLTKLVDALLAGHEDDEFRFRITFKQENGLPVSDTITYSIAP